MPCFGQRSVTRSDTPHSQGKVLSLNEHSVFQPINFIIATLGQGKQHAGSQLTDQGLKLCPLQWRHEGSTTGLPGKSLHLFPKSSFRFTAKLSGNTESSHIFSPYTFKTSPTNNISYQSGILVTTDETTLTCHYHQESIVYIRVHS